ncbi:MAG: c-type cytochrome [Paracoccaceae bacterium]
MQKTVFLAAALMLATPLIAQDLAEGRDIYAFHCSTCHGAEAKGNGPMSPNLVIQPTDLTRLSASNDATFPVARVVARIDGRDPLVAHGSPMPVFGEYFEGKGVALRTTAGQPIMTSQPIVDLITWLQSVQE